MGLWDQVAQLLTAAESTEKNRLAGRVLGKAVLLEAATEDCVGSVSGRDWELARRQLACLLIDIVNLMAELPEDDTDNG